MRKKRALALLLSGVIVAALAMGGALLLEGTSSTGGLSNAAPPSASARQVTPTTTTLSTSRATATQGTPVTLNATVTPAAAAGKVQFKDGSANIGDPVAVSNGSASQTTSTLAVGVHQLTAEFTPANPTAYAPSKSSVVPIEISGATATNTLLSPSRNSPVPQNTPLTLTATVNPATAAGNVQFKDGATNIGEPVAVSNGTASQPATLAVGSHQLTAVFAPTNPALFSPSTSPPVPFDVSGATTTSTTLSTSSTSSPTPVVEGTPVTLTATVNPATAVGTVQFRDGNTTIEDAVAVNNGTATTTTSTLDAGSHQLSAVFTPTNAALYSASTSPAVTLVIAGPATTSTTLDTSPDSPVAEDTEVALTATVTPSDAAGTVQFRDGNANIGPAVAVNNGTATRAMTFDVGSHQLTAVFTPTDDEQFAPSTSPPETFEVVPDPLLEAAAAVVPDPDPETQDGSERPGAVRGAPAVPTSAASSNGSASLMGSLTRGARLLTAMFPLNTVAYDPTPQSTDSLIVILEIGGELVDQIAEALDD